MDIKSGKDKYNEITNSEIDLKKIEKSIKIISSLLDYYEFRTTIIEDIHNEIEIEDIAKWLNRLCAGKPKKFVLQGFKNQGKFINNKYKKVKDTKEQYLCDLKQIIDNSFESVDIRI